MTIEQDAYKKARDGAYDNILAAVQTHIDAVRPPIMLNLNVLSINDTLAAAEHSSWTLLHKGIKHLKDGGLGGQPGLFTAALSKASLRNSLAAQSLGIKAPEYEENYYAVAHASGDLEALFFSRRLVEAALQDAEKSSKIIQRKVASNGVPLLQGETSIADSQLAVIFEVVRQGGGHAAAALPAKTPEIENLEASVRKQAMLTAKMQYDAFAFAGKKLNEEMTALFTQAEPVPPPPAPRRFEP